MKNKISKLMLATLMMFVTVFANVKMPAMAADKALLYVTGYEVTNETITPGEDFVLTVYLENYSDTIPAENVIVNIANPDGVIPEYGTVSTEYIDRIDASEKKVLKFNYSANSELNKTELNFNVSVLSDSSSTSSQLRIPVGRMTDFEVENKTVPTKMVTGKVSYVSAQLKNVSKTALTNVVMVARCDGVDLASASMGTISTNSFKTQNVGIAFYTPGKQAIDLVVTYTDGNSEDKEFVISSSIVAVNDEEVISNDDLDEVGENNNVTTAENDGLLGMSKLMLLSISGVMFIGVCCVVLILVYRRK